MMIAIESEGLFRTFMEFSFVLFLRVCSVSQDIFMLSFFDKTAAMLSPMLRKGIALAVGAVDYVNEGL